MIVGHPQSRRLVLIFSVFLFALVCTNIGRPKNENRAAYNVKRSLTHTHPPSSGLGLKLCLCNARTYPLFENTAKKFRVEKSVGLKRLSIRCEKKTQGKSHGKKNHRKVDRMASLRFWFIIMLSQIVENRLGKNRIERCDFKPILGWWRWQA